MSVFSTIGRRIGGGVAAVGRWLARAQSSPMQQMLAARAALMNGKTASAIVVNESTALKFSAVFASIRIIAETKASLPIHVYERLKGGKRARVDFHPAADLLHNIGPNDDMTPMVFQETRQAHVLAFGNNYAELTFDGRGNPINAWPVHPSFVTPWRRRDGMMMYRIDEPGRASRNVDRSQMVHVPGIGGDGLTGWSPIRLAAESIGIGLANEKFAATFFANGARPSLIAEHPGTLGDEEYKRLKDDLETGMTGDLAHKPWLFEGGMKANLLTMPLNEAQFLESRKFQGEEIAARIYRLPPHVAGYLDRAHFNNIEAMDLYFEKHTMRPWLERDEQEWNRKLFSRDDRRRFYVKHNVAAILRADITTRYQAYKDAILHGFKSVNEVRADEDMDGIGPAGDRHFVPSNHAALEGGGPVLDGRALGVDLRLVTLAERTLSGLVNRECVFARRAAKSPADFLQKVDAFYERQTKVIGERLADVADDEGAAFLTAQIEKRRRQLVETAGCRPNELETRVRETVESWDAEIRDQAGRLFQCA